MNRIPENWVRRAGAAGTLALFIALLIYLYQGRATDAVMSLIVLGLAGLSLWIVFASSDLRAWISGRQAAAGTTSFISSILFITFVVLIYDYIDKQNLTFDFTTETRYTLSQPSLLTVQRVRANAVPVQITAFYTRAQLREREAADIILRQFVAEGGDLLSLRYVDPDEQPAVANQYAYRSLLDRSNPIYISFLDENGTPIISSIRYVGAVGEREISTALQALVSVQETAFYFTTGHAELSLESETDTGLSRVRDLLNALGIQSGSLNLLRNDIPDDATALIIAGPSSDFDASEVEKIAAFVERGGRLWIMANPPYVDATFGGVSTPVMQESNLGIYLWDTFGVRFRDDLVVDPASSFDSPYNPVISSFNFLHPIMESFTSDSAIVMFFARSIEIEENPNPQQFQYQPHALIGSSVESYGETELQVFEAGAGLTSYEEGVDSPGPLPLAVAIAPRDERENPENTTRLLLVGDVDWASNALITRFDSNALLFATMAEWMGSDPTRIDFPVEQRNLFPLDATAQQRQRISILTTAILPLLVLATGGLVWFLRRRA